MPASAPADRLVAPSDCTDIAELDSFIQRGIVSVRRRETHVVVDLSSVKLMNSALLAAVIFLARESRDAGARLQLAGVSAQFRDWASTLGVWAALVNRGIVEEA